MTDVSMSRLKKSHFSLACLSAAGLALSIQASSSLAYEIDPDSTIADSPTTLLGINHIALSVRDLDAALAFYQGVTGYKVIRRETVSGDAAETLYSMPGIRYETAVLEAPNMLFELNAFSHNSTPVSSRRLTTQLSTGSKQQELTYSRPEASRSTSAAMASPMPTPTMPRAI
jgi:hypothetical protein